jgi:hypothetical protein
VELAIGRISPDKGRVFDLSVVEVRGHVVHVVRGQLLKALRKESLDTALPPPCGKPSAYLWSNLKYQAPPKRSIFEA